MLHDSVQFDSEGKVSPSKILKGFQQSGDKIIIKTRISCLPSINLIFGFLLLFGDCTPSVFVIFSQDFFF